MKRMTIAVLFAAMVLAVAATGGNAGPAQPLTPDQAEKLGATPMHATGGQIRVVSRADLDKAAAQPGALVERLGGASPSRAASAAIGRAAAQREDCWAHEPNVQWGTWPYNRDLWDYTLWCALVPQRAISYRVQRVSLGSYFCNYSGAYGYRVSGGLGYSWVESRAGGNWACPTAIPWITLHYGNWRNISRNAWGNWAETGHN